MKANNRKRLEMMPLALAVKVAAASILLLVSGCGKEQAESYEVPQMDTPSVAEDASATAELPAGHPPIDGTSSLVSSVDMSGATLPQELVGQGDMPAWTLPEGWSTGPDKPMRRATILAGEGGPEIAVTSFPGDVGGMEANVRRWRAQLGLGPISPTDMPQYVKPVEVDGREIYVVDLLGVAGADGTPPPRMLTAVVAEAGSTWFFKMTGSAPEIDKAKASFDAFVGSIRFGEAGEPL